MSLILYMSDLRINKTGVSTQQAVAQKRSSCANIRYWWVEVEQDWGLVRWREEEGCDCESVIELEREAWRRIMGRDLLKHFCWTGSTEEFLQWCLKVEFKDLELFYEEVCLLKEHFLLCNDLINQWGQVFVHFLQLGGVTEAHSIFSRFFWVHHGSSDTFFS